MMAVVCINTVKKNPFFVWGYLQYGQTNVWKQGRLVCGSTK